MHGGAIPNWRDYGFVNYRAVARRVAGRPGARPAETIYGKFFTVGDTIGVRLDMDRGALSFFKDGEELGKAVLIDMGVGARGVRSGNGVGAARVKAGSPAKRGGTSGVLYPCVGFARALNQVSLAGTTWASAPPLALSAHLGVS